MIVVDTFLAPLIRCTATMRKLSSMFWREPSEMQMKGAEKVTLHPGDTFYEDPEGIHLVGRNASDTKPAKTVVLLIKEKGAPILTPVND